MRETRKQLFNLRFQHATGQLDNPRKLGQVRQDIARIMTVQGERERSAARAEGQEA
ncbi:MAG: 50S ribosomal protein L29 [Actinobacteria bacterium]|nr:50S ribosomal protein L29 [Actinomycetota bacterium]